MHVEMERFVRSSFQIVPPEMASHVEVRIVVHLTPNPFMQDVAMANSKMLDTCKDSRELETHFIDVEVSRPMQALKEAVENALALVTVVLPYYPTVMLQLEDSLKPSYLSKNI